MQTTSPIGRQLRSKSADRKWCGDSFRPDPGDGGLRPGSDVMHRIAAPMVGGTVSVFILSLLVLPVVYGSVLILKERVLGKL